MGLLDDVSASINDVLDDLFSDESLVRSVTYNKYASKVYDRDEGHTVTGYDATVVNAVRLRHTTKSVKLENSSVEVGDRYYMFRTGDMPSGMTLSDNIIDDGEKLSIKAINDGFNFVYLVTVQGTGL